MLMTDIVKIILAAVIIFIMKRISHGSFYFGFGAKNLRESIVLASIALFFALCNVLEAVFFKSENFHKLFSRRKISKQIEKWGAPLHNWGTPLDSWISLLPGISRKSRIQAA